MRQILLLCFVALLISGCEKDTLSPDAGQLVTFHTVGDFTSVTRSVPASESDLTDIWLFDYVDGELVQSIHQSSDDDDFGSPSVTLSYGIHSLYFVGSRGESPSIDEESHVISWSMVRDTYWRELSVDITTGSASSLNVTLQRVSTRLRLTIDDAVPAGVTSVSVTPSSWYFGLDWQTGMADDERSVQLSVSVPASMAGTTGMVVNFHSISDVVEWNADVTIEAMNGSNKVGGAVISDAKLKRNRVSEYHGRLFGSSAETSVTIDNDWLESYQGEW